MATNEIIPRYFNLPSLHLSASTSLICYEYKYEVDTINYKLLIKFNDHAERVQSKKSDDIMKLTCRSSQAAGRLQSSEDRDARHAADMY